MYNYATVQKPCNNSERHIVDLTTCGLPCIPLFAHTHQNHEVTSTTAHRHEGFIEILFCRRGENTSCESDGKEIVFRPGDVFVAQPEHTHFLKTYPKSLRMYWMWIKLLPLKKQFPHLSVAESRMLVKRMRALPVHFIGGERIRRDFESIWTIYESSTGDHLRKMRLRLAVYNLLVNLTEVAAKPNMIATSSSLDAILKDMKEHPELQYSIDELAKRTGTNTVRLNQLFKRATGLPPHAYLTSLRIAKAKELLLSKSLPIAVIARRLGYQSSQYFSTQFREETGFSPGAWRSQRLK